MLIWQRFGSLPTPIHLGTGRDVFRAQPLVSFFISLGLVAFHALHSGACRLRPRRGTCIICCAASNVWIGSASASLTGCCRAAQYSRQSHAAGLGPDGGWWHCQALLVNSICFRSPVCLRTSSGRGTTIPLGPVLRDLRMDEDDSFGRRMGGCPWCVVRVALAVGGVEELPWVPGVVGWWCWTAVLAATVGSLSCCGFGFLSCFSGPPGALALALYLMLAWYLGL